MNEDSEKPTDDPPDQGTHPEFMREFEKVIRSYAEAAEAGKSEEANQAAFSALMMAASEAMRNPTPDLELAEQANQCETMGDWSGAEQAYRERLALNESAANPALKAKPQMNLSRLLCLVGRRDEAWALALAGTASARASDISTLVAMALENQAACALERGDTDQALQASAEAIGLLEPKRMTAHMTARLLVRRAECLLARGDLNGAESDLAASRELLDQMTPNLPGPIVAQARWWEVRAKLDSQAGKLNEAAELLNKAIEYRRLGTEIRGAASPYAVAALVKDYEALSELAQRRGNSAAAQDALSQASLLRAQAHLPAATGPA